MLIVIGKHLKKIYNENQGNKSRNYNICIKDIYHIPRKYRELIIIELGCTNIKVLLLRGK